MEGVFDFKPWDGHIGALNPVDWNKFLIENNNVRLTATFRETASITEKERMYAFLHKAVYPAVVSALTASGYSGIDNVVADYRMKAEFAKDTYINPDGEEEVFLLDKSRMSKARLHKYLSDILFYLEENFEHSVPDAEQYKNYRETGVAFKSVIHEKNT